MRIAVIDPLLFTLPYDQAFCAGLTACGHDVTLIGRAMRDGEVWNAKYGSYRELPVNDVFSPLKRGILPRRIMLAKRHVEYGSRLLSLVRILKGLRPDIIHFQWALVPFADLMLRRHLDRISPSVLTVHDASPSNGDRVPFLLAAGTHSLLRSFDRLFVHTQAGALHLNQQFGIPQGRIVQIAHGLLETAKSPDTMDVVAPAPADGLVRFLLFGLMKPYKGIDVLIRAVGHIPADIRRRCHFTIAGRPAMDLGPLQALAQSCGVTDSIVFESRHFADEEIPNLFSRSDVMLFPYREIEASGVFMLSLRYGKPVIASDIGVFRAMLKSGTHGQLVAPEDHVALAQAIIQMATDRDARQRMGRNVQELCERVPTWKEIAATTTTAYEQLLHEKSKPSGR